MNPERNRIPYTPGIPDELIDPEILDTLSEIHRPEDDGGSFDREPRSPAPTEPSDHIKIEKVDIPS